jgi:dihydroorotase
LKTLTISQPNLIPPIDTVAKALDYKSQLQALAPNVNFLMSLYLCTAITPEVIHEAARAGIRGVKSYPAGVTTNSASGVVDYESFYPVFAAMEQEGILLNLHGESPPAPNITVLNAEESFLPTLKTLHEKFPKLQIILEHCTTAKAVEMVRSCGENVVGTITAHHLSLIVDDWAGDPINFCKPVAKLPSDRVALLKAATSGDGKFFLGTDSAPHPLKIKKGGMGMDCGKCAAGVFTQPYATQIVLEAFEEAVEKAILKNENVSEGTVKGFLGETGRKFYGVKASERKIRITAGEETVVERLSVTENGSEVDVVVPFRRGLPVYSLQWL